MEKSDCIRIVVGVVMLGVFIIFLVVNGGNPPRHFKVPTRVSTEEAKKLIQGVTTQNISSVEKKDEFRNQIRIYTLTLSIAFLGLSRLKHPLIMFGLIFFFCGFMFMMNAFMWDISDRQLKYSNDLNYDLLVYDTLGDSLQQSVVQKIYDGIEPSDVNHKFNSALTIGRMDLIWFGAPAFLSMLGIVWNIKRRTRTANVEGVMPKEGVAQTVDSGVKG